MTRTDGRAWGACFIWALGLPALSVAATGVTVTVRNESTLSRTGETVEVPFAEVQKILAVKDPKQLHVADTGTKGEVLRQVVDHDGDAAPDLVIFQADFKPGETKQFSITVGAGVVFKKEDFRAYGRFVRERYDDFAWENDRVAFRTYGPALKTWTLEPLTSSTIDVWCKRTRRLVINDWYMADDYHKDHGEGADFYSAGKTRGGGGSGVFVDGKLVAPENFVESKVFANGPIRLVFELLYAPWMVKGVRVFEVKRVTLDAGQHLNRIESVYGTQSDVAFDQAVGLKKGTGSTMQANRERGWIRTWEPVDGGNGSLGLGLIVDPARIVDVVEADGNHLVIAKVQPRRPAVHWAGSAWDKGGDIVDSAAWEAYVDQFAQKLKSPLKLTFAAE